MPNGVGRKEVMLMALRPGDKAPSKGDYKVIGKTGKTVKTGITMDKGETLPPTPKKQQSYKKQ